jgi:hypothetical protein
MTDEERRGISLTPDETSLLIGACYGIALGAVVVGGTDVGAITIIVAGIAGGWWVGRL